MTRLRASVLTLLTMLAFAGNSLLCRLALKQTQIDPATFTFIRIASGAAILVLIVAGRRQLETRRRTFSGEPANGILGAGSWLSALALFIYAAGFSFAYVSLSAGTGALVLFAAVQTTMILWGMHKGERLYFRQLLGTILAVGGLVILVFPGLTAPPASGCILMLAAGVAWGVYSLHGKAARDPIGTTAGNFLRAVPAAAVLTLISWPLIRIDMSGACYAFISGSISSGLGYVIWYAALPSLRAASAATVQLSVPVLAAVGGIILLGEQLTLRFVCASLIILGGIALVVIPGSASAVPAKTNCLSRRQR